MWRKNFRTRKVQTVMIFLVIMLCSALMTSAASILISLDKPFIEFAKECDSATALLFPYSKEDADNIALGDEFAKLDEVDKVDYIRYYYLDEEITANEKKVDGFFRLAVYNDAVYEKTRYLEGNRNSAETLKDGDCIIPACVSTAYDIHVGDKVNINFSAEKKSYTVTGVYTNPFATSIVNDCDILINKLPDKLTSKLMLHLYGKDGINGNSIETAYREKYDGQLAGLMLSSEDITSTSLITSHILGAVFLAIGVIMLFVSALIINFMIRNAMITDAKNIAVYKTFGYTSGDILKQYMMFYFVIVTAACFAGIIGSIFLSNKVLTTVFDNIGQSAGPNVAIPGTLCYILIVGFVLSIISIIVGKTKKVKPVGALTGISSGGIKKKKNYKGNSKIQFSSFGIAMRTIMRSGKSIIGILITCIVTIFAINFGVISLDVANTLKDNNDYWLSVDKSDVSINVPDSTKFDAVSKLVEADERVDYSLNDGYDKLITFKWVKGMKASKMNAFVFDDYSQTNLPVVEGRNPTAENEIAIGSKIAGELNKHIGDYIQVFLGGTKEVNLLITGFFQSYYSMGRVCRLTTDVYTANDYEMNYNNMSIYLNEGEDMTSFINDMKGKIGNNGNVIPRTEQFSNIMDMIASPQQMAIPPVVVLVILLGSLNIFCIIMLKNANAQKTNGIYKCIGYSTGHLIRANLYYVGMVAAVSMAIALPVIVLVYPSIMRLCLSTFGFLQYPVTYIWSHIIIANIGVIAIFIISTLISSRSLHNVSARDLVQE